MPLPRLLPVSVRQPTGLRVPARRPGGLPQPGYPWQQDRFGKPAGTNPNGVLPDLGGPWTVRAGTWSVTAGRLSSTGSSPGAVGWVISRDAEAADYTVRAVLNLSTSSAHGIVVRYNPADGSYYLISLSNVGGGLQTWFWNGTTLTQLDAGGGVFAGGVDYLLRVRVRGATIESSVLGFPRRAYQLATSNPGSPHCGFRASAAADLADDLEVFLP